ncbi:MAG: (d)CMP kinase [Actinomycetota bacterium]|nr:(d)CMP kinase [Actinomycetota bacterium]
MTDTAGSDSRVIAIDGPSGTGKSSVAREVARRLRAGYLDTGAMYRAVTLAVLEGGIDPADSDAVADAAQDLRIEVVTDPEVERVLADGRDVTAEIRSPQVTAAVSAVSAVPGVRRRLVEQQRRLAKDSTVVVEGRDIGTVVFPAAPLKIYLSADPAARAARRAEQLGVIEPDRIAELAQSLRVRDELDSSRALSPLRPAEDAVLVDSTDLSQEEVVEAILSAVLARGRCE